MKFLICVVATTVLLANYTNANHSVRLREIYITQPDENYHSSLGIVNGVRHCGGQGRVIQWRMEGCSGEGNCRLEANDRSVPTELEFIPSEDIESLSIRINLVDDDDGTTHTVCERVIGHSSVESEQSYIVHSVASLSEEMKGANLTVQYVLFHTDHDQVEICAEADFEFY